MQTKDLAPNLKNPRTITDAKKAQLKKAMQVYGDLSGIVFNRKSNQLVGGHQRTAQFDQDAKIEIVKKYPKPTPAGTVAEGYILLKGERFVYREVSWSKHKEMAANIAANNNAGIWDMPQLTLDLKELGSFDVDFDLDLTMFDDEQLKELGGITVKEHTRVNAQGVDEDDVPEKAPAKTKLGDVYALGDHRLMCGDSTELAQVEKLMAGQKADFVFTSPPYNGNTELNSHKTVNGKRVYSSSKLYVNNELDNKSSEEYIRFNSLIFDIFKHAVKADGNIFYNINYNAKSRSEWVSIVAAAIYLGFSLLETIVWKKTGMPNPAPQVMTRSWEFIFLFNSSGRYRTNKQYSEYSQNFWEISNSGAQQETHKACFPVALPEKAIEQTTAPGDLVYEPFGGSGSTLIACEKTGRKCFMMELDPTYCDVIVARWEKWTGRTAKLVASAKPLTTKLRKKPALQAEHRHVG